MLHRPASDAVSVRVRDTHDADEQAACLLDWGQCYEQMSSGAFDGHFESYCFDGVELFREEANQVVQQYGRPRPGTLTIGALLDADEGGRFCGAPLTPDHHFFLRGGKEFHFRTPQRVSLTAVTVDMERFGAYCQRVGEMPPPGACLDSGLVRRNPRDDLGGLLGSLMQSLRHSPDMLRHATLRRCLEEGLHSTLLGMSNPTEMAGKDLTASTRQYVVGKARDYMREHVEEAITVSELCAHIRVSRRTLQYSFQDVLGTNPARYLRNMRLNGARREIRRQTDARAPMADIAAHWGFWHPSRFAAEYKSLFGELPSQTLKAATQH
ncbi:AraC family ethanolamine operon transcriptional activator [Hydrogenophaga palleronii]|uniref:AraC family ethanolamine operon transcriptional activator n=1 Tax=Hydrogenophaga palleronii TaxID=65655 RepID=A0ABU1WTZ3_9BURK|nr:AraC family ethanolamine operon transcriptional activator [Hydrogenophaga palleronii]